MRRKASALASFAVVAAFGGLCAINAGPAAADPINTYNSKAACQAQANRLNSQGRDPQSTTPGHSFYCKEIRNPRTKTSTWGLYDYTHWP